MGDPNERMGLLVCFGNPQRGDPLKERRPELVEYQILVLPEYTNGKLHEMDNLHVYCYRYLESRPDQITDPFYCVCVFPFVNDPFWILDSFVPGTIQIVVVFGRTR